MPARVPMTSKQRDALLALLIGEEVVVRHHDLDAEALANFARRGQTRYEQLSAIKHRHGFRDATAPVRAELRAWLAQEAVGLTDGRVLIDRLIARMREGRIVIPGASVVERMAAGAMHAADLKFIKAADALLSDDLRGLLDAILSEKEHAMLSRCRGSVSPRRTWAQARSSICSISSTLCAQPARPTS